MKLCLRLLLCLVLITACALGQTARTGTLVGSVSDSSGALVPGVDVTVRNLETSFVSKGQTNAEGTYYIPFLAVGTYELTVEASGFKTYKQSGIALGAGEVPRIDVRLELGAASESVEVTATAALLETETSQVSQTVQHRVIEQLPVMQMKAQRLLYYVEGLQIRGADASVAGQSSSALGFTLDGVSGKTSVRDAIGDTNTSVQPALDALAEAKVYTTGAPAEIGHASGGILSMTFRSGTNDLHGSIEDRWTNNAMTHRGYLEQGARTNPITFHQAQMTVSGPVVIPKLYNGKNKTFFLFAYGRHHEKTDEPQTATVPDADMLNGNFSFAKAPGGGYPIYDPASMRQVNGAWTADPFPSMMVPKSRIDPAIASFLALNPWQPANNPGGATYSRSGPSNDYLGYTVYRSYRNRYDFKVDQQVSNNNKFFVRNSWNRHRQVGRISAYLNNRLLDSATPSFGRPNPIDQQNWAMADYHTFSPTLMNEFRLGYGRRVSTIDPPTSNAGWAQKLGIPGVGGENFPSFYSGTAGTALYGITPGAYNRTINEDVTFQDNVTKVIGRHTIKFGYELIRTRENNIDEVLPSGAYLFTTSGTALPFVANTGNIFASFLLGAATSGTYTQRVWNRLPRWWSHSGYLQTDWRATPTLTLNLGLRYSVETPFQDKWGHQSQFNPTVVDPLTGKMGAITHPTGSIYNTDNNNFQPRLGMAWTFRKNMVFRGAWGLLTQDLMPRAGNEDYTATANVQPLPGDPRPAFYLSQGPGPRPFVINSDGTSQFIGTNYSGRGATYLDPNLHLPYVMNWSGSVQIQMRASWLTELLYQGSAGVGLATSTTTNFNQLAKSYYDSKDLTLLNSVYAATQNYRPYPQFGTIGWITNAGHSTYHGFTTRLEKRYAQDGLILNAHYTWSKNLSGTVGDGWQFYNWNLTKSPTSFDTRHRFIIQGMYDLPVGKGRKFLDRGGMVNAVLGGWNVLMVETAQSGPAVTFTFAGSPYNYLPGPLRPNQTSDPKVAGWDIGSNRFPQNAQNPLYNVNAFTYPAAFTNGTLGAGTTTGLWLIWPQWSLSKSWAAKERYKFTFRIDANNIPVRFMGQTPNTTVNLSSPESFGKFPLQTSSSYSTMGGLNGQIIIGGRFEF
jgi:hypothetical protein